MDKYYRLARQACEAASQGRLFPAFGATNQTQSNPKTSQQIAQPSSVEGDGKMEHGAIRVRILPSSEEAVTTKQIKSFPRNVLSNLGLSVLRFGEDLSGLSGELGQSLKDETQRQLFHQLELVIRQSASVYDW